MQIPILMMDVTEDCGRYVMSLLEKVLYFYDLNSLLPFNDLKACRMLG